MSLIYSSLGQSKAQTGPPNSIILVLGLGTGQSPRRLTASGLSDCDTLVFTIGMNKTETKGSGLLVPIELKKESLHGI